MRLYVETVETCHWALEVRGSCKAKQRYQVATQRTQEKLPRRAKTPDQLLPQSNAAPSFRDLTISPRTRRGRERPNLGDPFRAPSETKEPTAPNSERQDGSRSPPKALFSLPSALASLSSWRPCLTAHDDMMINPSSSFASQFSGGKHEKRSASCAYSNQDGRLGWEG